MEPSRDVRIAPGRHHLTPPVALTANSTRALASGNQMPVMGLGSWQLDDHTAEVIARAIELGYRMLDTSGDYGTQPGIGDGIRRQRVERNELYVVTKIEETDDAYQATRNNLAELQLDYADLVLIHRPPEAGAGEELWKGLIRAKREGLTHDIGVSNYSIEQMDELATRTGEAPVVNQIEWSPFGFSERMLEYCRTTGLVIQAYSPLTRTKRLGDATLGELARRHGRTPAQVLIRWNLQKGVVPIPKANRHEHLEQNLNVFDFALGEEDMAALDGLNQHYSSLGSLPYV